MKLGGQQPSDRIEDRRGIGMVGGGLGVGTIVIALVAYFLGFDPSTVLSVAEQVAPQGDTRAAPKGAPADEMGQFVARILGSTEAVWGKVFQASNTQYRPPTLVLYDGQVRSSCGTAHYKLVNDRISGAYGTGGAHAQGAVIGPSSSWLMISRVE